MVKYLLSLFCVHFAFLNADVSITIYNDNFALIRDEIELSLQSGRNEINYPGTTSLLEPNSVILKPLEEKHTFKIVEQNYQSDVVSQAQLLAQYEGREINFQIVQNNQTFLKKGKIIRSGYQPQFQTQYGYPRQQVNQPLIEMDGLLRFSLPGIPLFPKLGDSSLLSPTLNWDIFSDTQQNLQAVLSYMSGGLSWKADYNMIVSEKGNLLDLSAWITLNNRSGKEFDQANVKLMAGDVNKVKDGRERVQYEMLAMAKSRADVSPSVQQKSFDEFHLYTLQNKTDLRDKEIKQVEFLTTSGIKSTLRYVYNGRNSNNRHYNTEYRRSNRSYGAQSHEKVVVVREFLNTKENKLGVPLPKGKVRFYKENDDGDIEFVGENLIDHTPKNEEVKIITGNSFDLKGERKQVDFRYHSNHRQVDEKFMITIKNRKDIPVQIRVVEHLYRWNNWEITNSTHSYIKENSDTIHFDVDLKPNEEKELNYSVKYSW
jgi:hypothetical protein